LDLDLLLYDDVTMRTSTLELPHPRLVVRRFVLEPAAEIAGDMQEPSTGWSLNRLLEHLATAKPYAAITGLPGVGKTELAHKVASMTGAEVVALEKQVESRAVRSGSPQEVELEFVRARRAQLADRGWPVGGRWLVSDFWIAQSLAYARVELPPTGQRAVLEAVVAAQTPVMAPKLTVLLEGPLGEPETLPPRAVTPVARDALDHLAREMSNVVNQPEVGPVLRLDGGNPQEAARELASALETMR
jgi:hypothetical protein